MLEYILTMCPFSISNYSPLVLESFYLYLRGWGCSLSLQYYSGKSRIVHFFCYLWKGLGSCCMCAELLDMYFDLNKFACDTLLRIHLVSEPPFADSDFIQRMPRSHALCSSLPCSYTSVYWTNVSIDLSLYEACYFQPTSMLVCCVQSWFVRLWNTLLRIVQLDVDGIVTFFLVGYKTVICLLCWS